jgi:hypothetical protein
MRTGISPTSPAARTSDLGDLLDVALDFFQSRLEGPGFEHGHLVESGRFFVLQLLQEGLGLGV